MDPWRYSTEGISMMVGDAVENFVTFPALGLIIVVMLGVAVAEPAPRQIAEDAEAVPTVSATVVDSAR